MSLFLVILSNFLSIASTFPYLAGVVKGVVKPRIITWIIWSILTGVSCIASLFEGQYVTMTLLIVTTALTSSVAILGWRHGSKQVNKLDITCLICALVGIVIWRLSNSPGLAVIVMLIADLMGGLPTLIHSWQKPNEEEWRTFSISAVGSFCTLLAVNSWKITAFAFPLYLVVMGLTYSTIIITRRKYLGYKIFSQ